MAVKNYSKMEKVSIKSITPKGWLKQFLVDQLNGLTGNMGVAGYPFDTVSWGAPFVDTTEFNSNPAWWAYEQTAYWVDGAERLGQLLKSRKLLAKVSQNFEYVLENKDSDGYLGPKNLKDNIDKGGYFRWAHVVFFRALLSRYYATKDKSILLALKDHYLKSKTDLTAFRDMLNIEIILLVFLELGDKELLNLAEEIFSEHQKKVEGKWCENYSVKGNLSNKKIRVHGVSYNEYSKLGAILYICTGKREYLKPVIKAYKTIDRFFMLPDGLHCSDEFTNSNKYWETHETCDVTDYTWSLNYLLMATGNGEYADKIERCIFNAGIGSVEENFKALQYFSGLNQVILDSTSNHCKFYKGDKWMSYRPNPGTECCPGNVNRFFPNYCASMWFKKGRNTLFATLYGASEFTYGTGSSKVKIIEETAYPFSDAIKFKFSMKNERSLKLRFRIPAWCENAEILLNGKPIDFTVKKGFASVDRVYNDTDEIILKLPSVARKLNYQQGVYFEKGPLLFTLGQFGDRQIDLEEEKSTKDFPAYNIYPNEKWNYGIPKNSEISVNYREMTDKPFTVDTAPITLEVDAREIKNWTLEKHKTVFSSRGENGELAVLKGNFQFTPKLPNDKFIEKNGLGELEKITLVPYGCAKVRLSILKDLK